VARGHTAAAFLDRLGDVVSRGLQRRHRGEDDAGQQRQPESEREDRQVHADDGVRGQVVGDARENDRDQTPREQQAERAADDSEQQAFAQHLAHQPRAAGAERAADRELTASRGRSREHQLATLAHAMRSTKPTAPSSTSSAPRMSPTRSSRSGRGRCLVLVVVRVFLRQPVRDGSHLALGLFLRDARLQASHGVHAHRDGTVPEDRIFPAADGEYALMSR
jgi:hypothetical protein